MRARILLTLALALVWTAAAFAQQIQPVTLVADYNVKPGKEEEFLSLVKTVGQPVMEKLMAEGVVLAWGVVTPVLHAEGAPTHSIWRTTTDMGAEEKALAALQAQIQTLIAEDQKAAEEARKKRQPVPKGGLERFMEAVDIAKHKDWLARGLTGGGSLTPPAGTLPYFWISFTRVLPGKGMEYRQLWERYTKPTYDKLVSDGAIIAYGLSTQEAVFTADFTHYSWVALPNLAAREKVRAAFNAASQARSEETRRQITQSFLSVVDPPASRTIILRSLVYQAAPPR